MDGNGGHVLNTAIHSILLYFQGLSLPMDLDHSCVSKQMKVDGHCVTNPTAHAPAVSRHARNLPVSWSCCWSIGKEGHVMHGPTSDRPAWTSAQISACKWSIYTHHWPNPWGSCTACCHLHRSRVLLQQVLCLRCLSGMSEMHILSWWKLELVSIIWLPSDFLLQ